MRSCELISHYKRDNIEIRIVIPMPSRRLIRIAVCYLTHEMLSNCSHLTILTFLSTLAFGPVAQSKWRASAKLALAAFPIHGDETGELTQLTDFSLRTCKSK